MRPQRISIRHSPAFQSAKDADLRHVCDGEEGIYRIRSAKGFVYRDVHGKPMRSSKILQRIRSLAIPPAWTEVWICADSRGHLQATGRDARGRKQYRYHPQWSVLRDRTKYDRLVHFGMILPCIRKTVTKDLRRLGLPRRKVLAAIVRLLDTLHLRVGNEEYVRENHSYGLTTLLDRHMRILRGTIHFHFRGKSGKEHDVHLHDPLLARIVQRCSELPGQVLFQYQDRRGKRHTICSHDVNAYLREITHDVFTAKDFRTWGGTVEAAQALTRCGQSRNARHARTHMVKSIKSVAKALGNTPSTCQKYYIDPRILISYEEGEFLRFLKRKSRSSGAQKGLQPMESAVLRFLERPSV